MIPQRGTALQARREAVAELWRQGRSTAIIAATLGLTFGTVKGDVESVRKAKPDAVPRRLARLTAAQCGEISVRKAEGRGIAAIARAVGVHGGSVADALRKARMTETSSKHRPAVGTLGPQIVAMWKAGHTASAIADTLGLICVGSVYQVIGRMAPELRRQKEHQARVQRLVQQVAILRQQKHSHRAIACELGITRVMVKKYAHRAIAAGAFVGRGPGITKAEAREIIALNAVGNISGVEIARRLGVKKDAVYRVLRLFGVAPSIIAKREQLKPKILALWEARWTSDAIARVCNMKANTIRAIAHRAVLNNPAYRRQAPRLSPDEIQHIVALRRESHYSASEISELTGVSYPAVTRLFRELSQSEPGLSLNRTLIAENRLPEVMRLMAQGMSTAQIAKRFGVTPEFMKKLLYRLRQRARSRGTLISPGIELYCSLKYEMSASCPLSSDALSAGQSNWQIDNARGAGARRRVCHHCDGLGHSPQS